MKLIFFFQLSTGFSSNSDSDFKTFNLTFPQNNKITELLRNLQLKKRQDTASFLKKGQKQFPQDKGRKMRNLKLIISLAKVLLRHPEGKRRLHFNYLYDLLFIFFFYERRKREKMNCYGFSLFN